MSLLIQHADIVTAEQRYPADLLCENGRITRIGQDLPVPSNGQTIDASGKQVFPGFIDPHVHVYLPASGTLACDDYRSASQAALLGGTTSFIDFVLPAPGEDPLEALATWQQQAEGNAACDYSFHMAVSAFTPRIADQLRKVVDLGIPSFKVHLAYKGVLALDDEALFNTLDLARQLNALTMAHCENAELIEIMRNRLFAEGKTAPKWHYDSRPPSVEACGVQHMLTFAQLANAPLYLVHLSCKESLALAIAAREQQPVFIETLIQFLLLDKTLAEQESFEAAKYIMSPPLRDQSNQPVLWKALADGAIQTVSTDHAPFNYDGQKTMGRDDFRKIPSGLPGIQDRVNLLYSYGVCEDRISLHRFVDALSTQPAKIFGLYPRKGTIAEGSDADLVIFDPDWRGTISAKTHAMNVDYSAYEGWPLKGRPDTVILRGQPVVENGSFTGTFGNGQFLPRMPYNSAT
jgi:dihydropyrimidinase